MKDNRKRIAALIRMISSDQDGEVLNAAAALKRICSLNEIGDIIETGQGKLSNEEMQRIWDDGFEEGYDTGLKKGKQIYGSSGSFGSKKNSAGIYGSPPEEDVKKATYCHKHKEVLKQSKERKFVDDMIHWTVTLGKPLTPAQAKWIDDIYIRLMMAGLK